MREGIFFRNYYQFHLNPKWLSNHVFHQSIFIVFPSPGPQIVVITLYLVSWQKSPNSKTSCPCHFQAAVEYFSVVHQNLEVDCTFRLINLYCSIHVSREYVWNHLSIGWSWRSTMKAAPMTRSTLVHGSNMLSRTLALYDIRISFKTNRIPPE